MLGLLVVLSGFVWTRVFETTEDIETATRCTLPGAPTAAPEPTAEPQPEQPAALGQMLSRNALDRTTPVPARDVRVRVLNGNGEANQAGLISQELTNIGFAPGGEPDNDPVYPNYDLNCHGQIRFGGAGASQARTLSLMVPCAQLVRDDRTGSSLDLALGSDFKDIKSKPEARQSSRSSRTGSRRAVPSKRSGRRRSMRNCSRPPATWPAELRPIRRIRRSPSR